MVLTLKLSKVKTVVQHKIPCQLNFVPSNRPIRSELVGSENFCFSPNRVTSVFSSVSLTFVLRPRHRSSKRQRLYLPRCAVPGSYRRTLTLANNGCRSFCCPWSQVIGVPLLKTVVGPSNLLLVLSVSLDVGTGCLIKVDLLLDSFLTAMIRRLEDWMYRTPHY